MNRIVHPLDDRRTKDERKYIELHCIGQLDEWLLVIIPTQGSMVRAVKRSEYVFEDEPTCDDLI